MAIAEDYNSSFISNKLGSLEVKLASNNIEIDAAQNLRYKVFYEEMQAKPNSSLKKIKRDIDPYDPYFDHLLVIDHTITNKHENKVVGTYRLNRGLVRGKKNTFYTSGEYDVSKLINFNGNILELGRSCVHKNYRNGKTMQLLWKSIATYVFNYDIKIMFGCASFPGINITPHSQSLLYLYEKYLAPENIRPFALKERFVDMKSNQINISDEISIRKKLPPLIKGYLRLGAFVGNGAVIDRDFNTLDVCIVLPTKQVASRYLSHYER